MYKFPQAFNPESKTFQSVCALLGVVALITSLSHCVGLKHASEEKQCLALNIYHEARGEPLDGRIAVATVTMNRVISDKFPNDLCRVVFQRRLNREHGFYVGQFSWTQDHLSDTPTEDAAWADALNLARNVYENNLSNHDVKDALFYHATYISSPGWARRMHKITTIGQHVFYRNYSAVTNNPAKNL